jgi:WhiB family transcriptional regulator, redox-sensing transcriptional regulator
VSSHINAGLRDWMVSSACRGADPRLFFPDPDEHGYARAGLTARAKAICAHCPVRGECLAYALATRQKHGVWGGTTEQERRMMMAA